MHCAPINIVVIALIGAAVLWLLISIKFEVVSERPGDLAFDDTACDCTSTSQRGDTKDDTRRLDTRLWRSGKLGSTFLLILIPHLYSKVESRDLIRNTWYKGFSDSPGVMLRYVIGTKGLDRAQIDRLHSENETHGDIVVLEDFTEGEQALTNKTVALIQWATKNVDFIYLMKCDDDTFVYVNNAIAELKRRPTPNRLYYGVMLYNDRPNHNEQKWNDDKWNLAETYTPFARGGCYILSQDLVFLLAKHSGHLKRHVLEDVAVGSWLVPFDYERRDDDLICFNTLRQHPCRRGFRIAHLFYGKTDKQLRATFLLLQAQSLLH